MLPTWFNHIAEIWVLDSSLVVVVLNLGIAVDLVRILIWMVLTVCNMYLFQLIVLQPVQAEGAYTMHHVTNIFPGQVYFLSQ